MEFRQGDVIAGKYRIVARIGGGNMGDVYEAEHVMMPKRFAIKLLHSDIASKNEYIERFRREAEAACTLDHPNICAAVDFGRLDSGDLYFVMEMLTGETLTHRLQTAEKLLPLDASMIMRQLLSALQCASEHGVVHRDVKPDNIMLVSKNDMRDIVKLFDFGIAHGDELGAGRNVATLTQAGQIYGTPQYMAPEQITGDCIIDSRADLYAAGAVFYEMLTGTPPFIGSNFVQLFHDHLSTEPPHLDATIPCVEALDAIIQKLLKKNPDERFQTANDAIAALDRVIVRLSGNPLEFVAAISTGQLQVPNFSANLASVASTEATPQNLPPVAPPPNSDATLDSSASQALKLLPQSVQNDVLEALPKTQSGKRGLFFIGGAVIVLTLTTVFLTILFSNSIKHWRNSGNNELGIDHQTGTVIYQEPPQSTKAKPQPYNYTERYRISYDSELSKDQNIVSAAENLIAQNFKQAVVSLQSVKDTYKEHPNFVRLYLVALYGVPKSERDYDEIFQTLGELFDLVKDASENPSVREIIYDFYNTKDRHQIIADVIKKHADATAVAKMIVESPFDRFIVRKERLIATYESMDTSHVPKWLATGVAIWKTDVGDCKMRLALLETYGAVDDALYENVLLKIAKVKRCNANGFKFRDCHSCLRDFIEVERVRRTATENPKSNDERKK